MSSAYTHDGGTGKRPAKQQDTVMLPASGITEENARVLLAQLFPIKGKPKIEAWDHVQEKTQRAGCIQKWKCS